MLLAVEKTKSRTGTFVDNLSLPVHRWFRYPAGFSAAWVCSVLKEQGSKRLFDPFVGSGTSLIAADSIGIESRGFESHPFVCRIAQAKLSWDFDRKIFDEMSRELLELAASRNDVEDRSDDKLLGKIYAPEILRDLDRLRISYDELYSGFDSDESRLLWLGITSILRSCSFAGTAQWQYVLPNKRKSNAKIPFDAFNSFCTILLDDSFRIEIEQWHKKSRVINSDARNPFVSLDGEFDLVVTSPPYPNNYDYADATRIEMTFWQEVEGWKDLQTTVRKYLMRSCSQHAAAEHLKLEVLLSDKLLDPIRDEITAVCEQLAEVRLTKGGKKTYHTMIAAYFLDLANVFMNLRPVMSRGSLMCFVIGDSAPYGVHVQADKWLAALAMAAGFKDYNFEKLRDRNVKWDNRVHKVPLHEGNLWIKG
ncbi:MAG TPA: hypothetical protein VN374_01295 [Desulfitobacteriaceae bacterium]|nr:hypothetical protein [Desulfitobacteriaceae bacterium]